MSAAELSPREAARLAAIEAAPWAEEAAVERVARAMWESDWSMPWPTEPSNLADGFRRLAVAAIDVMRGATDDGAVGRVQRLAEWADRSDRRIEGSGYVHVTELRAAIGAPATAEGDN